MPRSFAPAAGLVAGLAAASLALTACGSGPDPAAAGPSAAPGSSPIQVTASTDVWGSVVQAVGGNRVAVTSIINSPDKDPHEYESTPADATAVGSSALIVENGGGYDDFVGKLVSASGSKAEVIDAVDVSGLRKPGDQEFNEHVWYSLPTVQKVARTVADRLGRIDPSGAAEFTANAQRFDTDVQGLITRAQAIGTANPGARVAITEPVPGYLLQTAKVANVSPPEFSEAVEEGNDPPAAVLQKTLALFTAKPPVSALVLNDQTQSPTTDQVRNAATSAGVPVVGVSETLPAGTTDYTSWISSEIDALAKAIDRR